MDKVWKILQLIVSTLHKIDDTACIIQFNQSLIINNTAYEVLQKLLVADTSSLPQFSLKLAVFFPQYKPRNNKTYTKIQLIHSNPLENIIENLKDEQSHHNLAIYRKALQYWDTSLAGWIVYFDPRCNPSDLASFLTDPIKKITKFDSIFTFRGKRVYNGSQKQAAALKWLVVKKKK